MSDYDLPNLPSDEELGITDEDREKYGDEMPDDGPELSAEEMAELLGDSPSAAGGAAAGGEGADPAAARKAADKEAKKAAKEARRRAKAEKKAEAERQKAEKKAEAEQQKAAKKAAKAEARGAEGAAAASSAGSAGGAGSGQPAGQAAPADEAAPGRAPVGAPPALASMAGWRGPVTLLLMIGLALFASTRTGRVAPGSANTPETEFSSARAMAIVSDIARQAHPPGSPEHERVRGLLVDRLRALGLEPEVQTATFVAEGVRGDETHTSAATVRNIVARIPGANPTGTLLITAHYDSRGIAIGAGDDASGVATILEAVRALRTGPAPRNDVIVLITDAEELGLMGARAFVDEHPSMPEVDLVLSFEMRGGGGPSIMFETNDRNGWVVRAFRDFSPRPFANSMSYEVYRRMPRDTDFTPFREAGVQGLNFAAIDNAHVYHQVYDTPENLSTSTLQHHGIQALAGLRYFGDADLALVDDENVVFFSLPGLGLFVYGQGWVLPLSLALVGGFVFILLVGGFRASRVVAGTLLTAALGALAYGGGVGAFAWLAGRHVELGALQGSAFHGEGWYLLALVLLALALVCGAAFGLRRWIAPVELAVGGLVLPLVAAVAAGFVAPLAAMNLQWPVAAGIAAVLLMVLLRARAAGMVGWVVFLALAVPVFLFLQPVIELLWLAMSLQLAGVLAAIAVTGFVLCLPLLVSLSAPNRWWAPVTATALAATCLGVGLATAGPSAERPAPSTLLYAYEHGSDEAYWVTSPLGEEGAESSDPGDHPGRAWAVDRAGAAFSDVRDLEAFGYARRPVPVSPARLVTIEPPSVVVAADTVRGEARRVVMNVRSNVGAELMLFRLGEGTRASSLNGKPLSNVDRTRLIEHWGAPDSAVVLELVVPIGSEPDLDVVEHLLRPAELLGRDAFRRPPELAPDINWLSDRAMIRTRLGARDVVTPPPDAGVPDSLIQIRADSIGPAGS